MMTCKAYCYNDFHCISCTDDVHIVMAVKNNKPAPRGLNKLVEAMMAHVALYEFTPIQDVVEIMSRFSGLQFHIIQVKG